MSRVSRVSSVEAKFDLKFGADSGLDADPELEALLGSVAATSATSAGAGGAFVFKHVEGDARRSAFVLSREDEEEDNEDLFLCSLEGFYK